MNRFTKFLLVCAAFAVAAMTMPEDVRAAEDIGGATKIVRTVTGRLSGATARLARGDRVFRNQRLRAASQSLGQFQFTDGTRLALNANASVKLDRYVYAGGGSPSRMLLKAARGAFRFATGSMPSKSYRITTPSSTIGVRGTWFDVYVGRRGQTIVTAIYGTVEACNRAGSCRTLDTQCESVRIEPSGQMVTSDRPDETILAGESARRAIPFMVSQYNLARSLRIPYRMAARCSNAAELDEDPNNDGGEGGEDGGESDGGGSAGAGPGSDIRLKRDIHAIGHLPNGLTLYRFKYTWSDKEWVGVMAQDVLKVMPEAVQTGADGFYRVSYRMLGLKMVSYAQWLASGAARRSAALAP